MTDDAIGAAEMGDKEAARARLAGRQRATVGLLFVGYAGYYLCRSNLSVCTPQVLEELTAAGVAPGSAKWRLGLLVSLGTLAYALGKFVGGGLADAAGGRRNFLGGMAGAVAFTLLFAAGGGLPVFTLAWVGNRLVQSFGWAGLVKITSALVSVHALRDRHGRAQPELPVRRRGVAVVHGPPDRTRDGLAGVFVVTAFVLSMILAFNVRFLVESPDRLGLPEPPANPVNVVGVTADAGDVLAPYRSLLRSTSFRSPAASRSG